MGSQDQFISAHGGFLHLQFLEDGNVNVEPLPLSETRLSELNQCLMMMYTGVQRTAHEILAEQISRTDNGELDDRLGIMKELVAKATEVIGDSGQLNRFGELLDESWELKRSLSSKISNPWLDEIYGKARSAGAIGGKLLGAGSGGFMLFFVEPDRQKDVRRALPGLREVRFRFEPQGTRIIYYMP